MVIGYAETMDMHSKQLPTLTCLC